MVGLDVLGGVEAADAVVVGKIEVAATGERFAGVVGGWLDDGARLARGTRVILDGEIWVVMDKLASLQFALDALVDVLLRFRAKAIPKSHACLPPPFELAKRSQQSPDSIKSD